MKALKRLSAIFVSVFVCILSAIIFTGCDKDEKTCKLYVFSTQGGYVLVDDDKTPVEFGDEGSKTFTYNQGSTVKLKAVAESGYVFVKWECTDKLDESVQLSSQQLEFSINDTEVVIRAKFILDGTVKCSIGWETGTGYQIVPLNGYSTEVGLREDFKFKVNAVEGYDLSGADIKANGTKLQPDSNGVYTVTDIFEDITITVGGVVKKEYKISVDDTLPAHISINPLQDYTFYVEHGDDFKFIIDIRDDGYNASNLTVYANSLPLSAENGVYTISNITNDIELSLEITKYTYDILYDNSQNFDVVPEDEYSFNVSHGSDFKFMIKLDEGYSSVEMQVYAKTDNVNTLIYPDSNNVYTIENIQDDVEIVVEGVATAEYIITYSEGNFEVKPEDGYDLTIDHGHDFKFKIVIHEGYNANTLKVYSDDTTIYFADGVYEINNITSNVHIYVEEIFAVNPKPSTFNFSLKYSEDVIEESGYFEIYMPDQLTFTFIEGSGEVTYNSADYPDAFECYNNKYSASEFEELINGILNDDLWLGEYALDCLAADQNFEDTFLTFNGDEFTVNWDKIPNSGTIYVGLKTTTK